MLLTKTTNFVFIPYVWQTIIIEVNVIRKYKKGDENRKNLLKNSVMRPKSQEKKRKRDL